jgi:hypothetical protein
LTRKEKEAKRKENQPFTLSSFVICLNLGINIKHGIVNRCTSGVFSGLAPVKLGCVMIDKCFEIGN